jgi:hypothetical protein
MKGVRTPSIVGIKNCALWSSVVPAVHQLAYRPSVQHVIDLTRGYNQSAALEYEFHVRNWSKPWDHSGTELGKVLTLADVAQQLRCSLITFISV